MGDPQARQRAFAEKLRSGARRTRNLVEDYVEVFPGQTILEIAQGLSIPPRSASSHLHALEDRYRVHRAPSQFRFWTDQRPRGSTPAARQRDMRRREAREQRWYPGANYELAFEGMIPEDLLAELFSAYTMSREWEVARKALEWLAAGNVPLDSREFPRFTYEQLALLAQAILGFPETWPSQQQQRSGPEGAFTHAATFVRDLGGYDRIAVEVEGVPYHVNADVLERTSYGPAWIDLYDWLWLGKEGEPEYMDVFALVVPGTRQAVVIWALA